MRRPALALMFALLSGLLAAAATAAPTPAPTDGSLVVRNGAALWNVPGQLDTPVVALKVTGSAIGRVVGYGRIVIDAGSDIDAAYQVTGAGRPADSKRSDTAQVWTANDFTFRAVGGTFTILIYGSDVNLVAAGTGTVRLAGTPDMPHGDGQYSVNDADFRSLPGIQTPKLLIGTGG